MDALEGLLMLVEVNNVDVGTVNAIFRKSGMLLEGMNKWQGTKNSIVIRKTNESEFFSLGALTNENVFDFKKGEILFTKRNFNFN